MFYLLDADVFLQAKNKHYGFDFCPAFWSWLLEQGRAGRVGSVVRVGEELLAGSDELAEWASDVADELFLPPDGAVTEALDTVATWAGSQNYKESAMREFMTCADSWLVAHALAKNCTVVTQERRSDSAKKIKIPDACAGLDVPCIDTFKMLRVENARFVLEKNDRSQSSARNDL